MFPYFYCFFISRRSTTELIQAPLIYVILVLGRPAWHLLFTNLATYSWRKTLWRTIFSTLPLEFFWLKLKNFIGKIHRFKPRWGHGKWLKYGHITRHSLRWTLKNQCYQLSLSIVHKSIQLKNSVFLTLRIPKISIFQNYFIISIPPLTFNQSH